MCRRYFSAVPLVRHGCSKIVYYYRKSWTESVRGSSKAFLSRKKIAAYMFGPRDDFQTWGWQWSVLMWHCRSTVSKCSQIPLPGRLFPKIQCYNAMVHCNLSYCTDEYWSQSVNLSTINPDILSKIQIMFAQMNSAKTKINITPLLGTCCFIFWQKDADCWFGKRWEKSI